MGYKYGIWAIYDNNIVPTNHIGHFTVTCFMEKEDAINLYNVLVERCGLEIEIEIDRKHAILFDKNMYKDEDNNMSSWGYIGHCKIWNELEEICKKYKCNFSHQIHTSIEYSKNDRYKKYFKYNYYYNTITNAKLHVVDITSDKPEDWKIII